MIIYIDNSIAERGTLTDSEQWMFTELACAHVRGYCYLCGDTKSIDFLKAKVPSYQRVSFAKYAELGTLFKAVETLVIISCDGASNLPDTLKAKKAHDESSVRIFSLEEAVGYRLNEQCILLGESTNDCKFYQLVGQRYMHCIKDSIRGIDISLKNENGGGDSTHNQLDRCVKEEHHLTFCLTDSDKKHGTSKQYVNEPGIGKTAGLLKEAEKILNDDGLGSLFELYCLDVHEAENLIPLSLLEELHITDANGKDRGITYLRLLQSKRTALGDKYPEVLLCYDIKNGIKIQDLRQKSAHPQFKKKPLLAYWEEIIAIVEDDSLPGVANDALILALERMAQKDPSGNERVLEIALDSHLVDYWNTIGKKVFSWGFANKPRATNPSRC